MPPNTDMTNKVLGESPTAYAEALRYCTQQHASLSAEERNVLAKLVDSTPDKAPGLVCRRVIDAQKNNVITSEETNAIFYRGALSDKYYYIYKGKPVPPNTGYGTPWEQLDQMNS